MVLIECEIEDNKVVLSDEVKWTVSALNNFPFLISDEEYDWYYYNNTLSNENLKLFKHNTWLRVFDISESEYIQATFWELRKENIIKIWEFNN